MNSTLFGISWAATQNVMLLPVIVGALILVVWRFKKLQTGIKQLASAAVLSRVLKNYSPTKEYLKVGVRSVGIFFLFLALLRPQWNMKEELVMQDGRDVMIALDVSRSMLASDIKPNRLDRAKEKIRALVQELAADRIGLILFAGTAFVQCPLTADHAAFELFLRQIDADTISSGTTAIEQALRKALQAFAAASERKNKLLVLFTDGEDFSSNLQAIKQEAHARDLHIFTVGVGTPQGAPVPLLDEQGKQVGHQRDKDDKVVISRLDDEVLSALAQETGGHYARMSDDNADIKKISSLVQQFEKERLHEKKMSAKHEQYHYFAAVSFICFVLEWLL